MKVTQVQLGENSNCPWFQLQFDIPQLFLPVSYLMNGFLTVVLQMRQFLRRLQWTDESTLCQLLKVQLLDFFRFLTSWLLDTVHLLQIVLYVSTLLFTCLDILSQHMPSLLLVTKCLRIQFEISSFLSCLLCVDTMLIHSFFNAWMTYRLVLSS